jgi:hypothetical protein
LLDFTLFILCLGKSGLDGGLLIYALFAKDSEDFTDFVLALDGDPCAFHVNLLVCYIPILSDSYITVKVLGETRFARKRLTVRFTGWRAG